MLTALLVELNEELREEAGRADGEKRRVVEVRPEELGELVCGVLLEVVGDD